LPCRTMFVRHLPSYWISQQRQHGLKLAEKRCDKQRQSKHMFNPKEPQNYTIASLCSETWIAVAARGIMPYQPFHLQNSKPHRMKT
jgi:hypothetical protein